MNRKKFWCVLLLGACLLGMGCGAASSGAETEVSSVQEQEKNLRDITGEIVIMEEEGSDLSEEDTPEYIADGTEE